MLARDVRNFDMALAKQVKSHIDGGEKDESKMTAPNTLSNWRMLNNVHELAVIASLTKIHDCR